MCFFFNRNRYHTRGLLCSGPQQAVLGTAEYFCTLYRLHIHPIDHPIRCSLKRVKINIQGPARTHTHSQTTHTPTAAAAISRTQLRHQNKGILQTIFVSSPAKAEHASSTDRAKEDTLGNLSDATYSSSNVSRPQQVGACEFPRCAPPIIEQTALLSLQRLRCVSE